MPTIMNKTKAKHRKSWPYVVVCLLLAAAGAISFHIFPFVSLTSAFLSFIFLVIGLAAIPAKPHINSACAIFKTLPDNYYVFENICINSSRIEYVIICPKGIYTIECSLLDKNLNMSSQDSGKNKFIPIKQAIMNSKSLNDFMQKNKVGNYFVDTLLLSNFWDDKMKTYFPDIPAIKPDEFCNYIQSREDKYSEIQCKVIAELFDLNLRIQSDMDSFKKDIANNSKSSKIASCKKTSI